MSYTVVLTAKAGKDAAPNVQEAAIRADGLISMRVGIYTRLSRDPDGTQTATARQEADCRALISREGWEVGAVYEDTDLSGFKAGVVRPDYERMLDDLATGSIGGIVVWKLDRLSRQPGQFEAVVSACERVGARLYSVHESADMTSPAGLAMMRVGMAFAAMESQTISLRTRRAKAEAADAGRPNGGGLRPFGLDRSKSRIVESEAALIREAAARVIAGEGLKAIAQDWQDRGVLSTRGNPWTVTALKRMLTSRRLEGMRVHQGRAIPSDSIPEILDAQTAERVRQLLARTGDGFSRRPRALSGLVRCGLCGSRMTVKRRQRGQPLYRCFKSPGEPNCGKVVIAAEPVEALVGDVLAEVFSGPELAHELARGGGQGAEVARELIRLRTQREELVRDHYVTLLVSRGDFLPAHAAVSDRIAHLEAELSRQRRGEVLAELAPGETIGDAWSTRGPAWCREVAGTYIAEVMIAPSSTRGSNRVDLRRVSIVWRSQELGHARDGRAVGNEA